MFKLALQDIWGGLSKYQYWCYMAWQEIVIRYRRSVLGPFWITASTAIYIIAISVIFSALFNQDIKHYLLYMTLGILTWNFMSQCIVESTDAFIANAGFIKQVPLEKSVFIYQTIMRNVYFFLHNFILIVICLTFLESKITIYGVSKSIFGFGILVVNLTAFSFLLATICTRFMDLRQIIYSVIQIVFMVTPIMWIPNEGMRKRAFIIDYNPVFHFIDFIRRPLLPDSFPVAITQPNFRFIVIFTFVNLCMSFLVFAKSRRNIAYWV
ncbi:ABC-2 type transport system permease protein/lipopolysaccharide transport system permease protein [Aeromonas sp. RU39B]|uniref:ABC transporter permease n=1 Tax=Aeromonas sp. RU39B TaxID=1907416 RepID=UPI000956AF5C|nr:ABC transporter permease [Aeromonas sp. RU39B]SIQ13879.1 ABC-2 type transport system permease protein/lipopolysaccharide transport system permease protein [Aeromonas sp. RU39B]